jgi:hypothetical protein
MHIRPIRRAAAVVVSVATVLGGSAFAAAAPGSAGTGGPSASVGIRHVLLISVDGLHQQDLTWYVRNFRGRCWPTWTVAVWSTPVP